MISTSSIDAEGKIAIPRAIRDYFNIAAGDTVRFVIEDKQLKLVPVKSFLDYQGIIKVAGVQDFRAIRAQVRQHISQELCT